MAKILPFARKSGWPMWDPSVAPFMLSAISRKSSSVILLVPNAPEAPAPELVEEAREIVAWAAAVFERLRGERWDRMRHRPARRIGHMTARLPPLRTVPAVMALAVLGWIGISNPAASAQSAGERTIFFAALDEAGKPVRDIKTEEILIREDGVDRNRVGEAIDQNMNIMLLADTTAALDEMLLDVRTALIAFVSQVHAVSPDAQISLMEFGQAAVTAVPFTTSDADLAKGINRLSGKPRSASVLLEAINAASNNLAKRPSPGAPSSRSTSSRATNRAARNPREYHRVPSKVRGAVVVCVDPEGRAQESTARRRAECFHEEHRRRPRVHRRGFRRP